MKIELEKMRMEFELLEISIKDKEDCEKFLKELNKLCKKYAIFNRGPKQYDYVYRLKPDWRLEKD